MAALRGLHAKTPSTQPNRDKPFTLAVGLTVDDLALAIHRKPSYVTKFGLIWGDERFSRS